MAATVTFRSSATRNGYKPKNRSALPTVRHDRQPAEACREQYQLGNRAGNHVAHKSELTALCDPSCHEGDDRVCPQVTRRRTEQLGQASGTDRTKYRQAHGAPRQV